MEIRQNAPSVPTRPIVLVMATLSVLALALTSWYALASSTPHHSGGSSAITTTVGPDASDRNLQILQARGELQSKAETTHGH